MTLANGIKYLINVDIEMKLRFSCQQLVTTGKYAEYAESDMEFVQNFTPPDFQAKNFTPSISPNCNSFSKKKRRTPWLKPF